MPELVMLQYIHHLISWDRTYFGYNSAVMIGGSSPLTMIYYSWPEGSSDSPCGPSNSLVGKVDKETRRSLEYSAFDECSGRVVVEAGEKLLVYDFAKFKNVSCTVT